MPRINGPRFEESDLNAFSKAGADLVATAVAMGWAARWQNSARHVITLTAPEPHRSVSVNVPTTNLNHNRAKSTLKKIMRYTTTEALRSLIVGDTDVTHMPAAMVRMRLLLSQTLSAQFQDWLAEEARMRLEGEVPEDAPVVLVPTTPEAMEKRKKIADLKFEGADEPDLPFPDDEIDTTEAAGILGVSRSLVYMFIKDGVLPASERPRPGGGRPQRYVKKQDVIDLAARRVAEQGEKAIERHEQQVISVSPETIEEMLHLGTLKVTSRRPYVANRTGQPYESEFVDEVVFDNNLLAYGCHQCTFMSNRARSVANHAAMKHGGTDTPNTRVSTEPKFRRGEDRPEPDGGAVSVGGEVTVERRGLTLYARLTAGGVPQEQAVKVDHDIMNLPHSERVALGVAIIEGNTVPRMREEIADLTARLDAALAEVSRLMEERRILRDLLSEGSTDAPTA